MGFLLATWYCHHGCPTLDLFVLYCNNYIMHDSIVCRPEIWYRPVPEGYFVLMCGAGPIQNLSDLSVAWSQYDIMLCSETLVSELLHTSELWVPGFGCFVSFCLNRIP